MSGFLIAALVFVVIVAAAVALLGAANRRQAEGATGASTLGREAIRRDKAARKERAAQEASAPPTGREIERVAVAERSTDLEKAPASLPAEWVAPDPEAYDESRRAFLNRSIVALMGLGIAGFAAGAFTAFLWPTGSSGFGSKIRVGKISDENIYYLMSRGLSEEQAIEMIVNGFMDTVTKELPLEYAVELNKLITLEIEGGLG